eukprot:TRINITY_DN1583_c0_g1_i1.p1 TRINITY_DN1583_c0_g1~~TRINITY_DN1583_c0_g1_i1.p1  ORF type:complete len:142 (-),score=22.03 TRINITY_DN1583_c0_g1_i1:156-545(-)
MGCRALAKSLFPQCPRTYDTEPEQNRCFNYWAVAVQSAWEQLAADRPYLSVLNLLGVTQFAAHYENVTIGHPDLERMGPEKYWPDYELCFHPGVVGKDNAATVIMEEFYSQYWGSELQCKELKKLDISE